MDVKTYIFSAAEKLVDFERAQEAANAAKAALELAKQQHEDAKTRAASAKDEYTDLVARCDEFGLSKSKFKDAIEKMKGILVELGAMDADDTAKPKDKASSKKASAPSKSEDASTTVETAASEPSGPVATSVQVDEDDRAIEVGEPVSVQEPTSDTELQSTSEELVLEEKVEEVSSVTDAIDNSEVLRELNEMIEDFVSDLDARTVLSSVVSIVGWHAAHVEPRILSVSPSPLTLTAVLDTESVSYVPSEILEAYEQAVKFGGEQLSAVLDWFASVIEQAQDGKSEFPNFAFHLSTSTDSPAADTPVHVDEADDIISAPESVSNVAEIDEISLFSDEDADGEPSAEPISEYIEPPEDDAEVEVRPEPVEEPKPAAPIKVGRPSWLGK